MSNLAAFLSSKAKVQILRTLSCVPQGLPLRHIAYLAKLPVYSVQLALHDLHKHKILTKKKVRQFLIYGFNSKHAYAQLLAQLFHGETHLQMQKQRAFYARKVKSTLAFFVSGTSLLTKVKRI